jgi:hypothetical protein
MHLSRDNKALTTRSLFPMQCLTTSSPYRPRPEVELSPGVRVNMRHFPVLKDAPSTAAARRLPQEHAVGKQFFKKPDYILADIMLGFFLRDIWSVVGEMTVCDVSDNQGRFLAIIQDRDISDFLTFGRYHNGGTGRGRRDDLNFRKSLGYRFSECLSEHYRPRSKPHSREHGCAESDTG